MLLFSHEILCHLMEDDIYKEVAFVKGTKRMESDIEDRG